MTIDPVGATEIAARCGIDPVGATEIAARCGIDLGTVKKWQQRHPSFPPPRRLVGNRPAWDWALDIAPWLAATGRPVPDVTIQPWDQETTMLTTTKADLIRRYRAMTREVSSDD